MEWSCQTKPWCGIRSGLVKRREETRRKVKAHRWWAEKALDCFAALAMTAGFCACLSWDWVTHAVDFHRDRSQCGVCRAG